MNQYELLGISRGATLKQVKNGFRQQIMKYHPDVYTLTKGQPKDYAEHRTSAIVEAYQALRKELKGKK